MPLNCSVKLVIGIKAEAYEPITLVLSHGDSSITLVLSHSGSSITLVLGHSGSSITLVLSHSGVSITLVLIHSGSSITLVFSQWFFYHSGPQPWMDAELRACA